MNKTSALVAALIIAISAMLAPPANMAKGAKFPPTPAWIQQRLDQGQRCPQFEDDFLAVGLPPKIMSYVSYRESRCRVGAVNARFDDHGRIVWTLNKNGTFDSGLLQVNSSHKTIVARVCHAKYGDLRVLLTLHCNLKVAKYLYDHGGLYHWNIKA